LVLACAACRRAITSTADRLIVRGAPEHMLTNPHGYRYHVGCFSRAHGCIPIGEATEDFTWFPPYAWQVEVCGGCTEHLGWIFRTADHHFHGLVLDRLVQVDEDASF
jgi:hypothetical protein